MRPLGWLAAGLLALWRGYLFPFVVALAAATFLSWCYVFTTLYVATPAPHHVSQQQFNEQTAALVYPSYALALIAVVIFTVIRKRRGRYAETIISLHEANVATAKAVIKISELGDVVYYFVGACAIFAAEFWILSHLDWKINFVGWIVVAGFAAIGLSYVWKAFALLVMTIKPGRQPLGSGTHGGSRLATTEELRRRGILK